MPTPPPPLPTVGEDEAVAELEPVAEPVPTKDDAALGGTTVAGGVGVAEELDAADAELVSVAGADGVPAFEGSTDDEPECDELAVAVGEPVAGCVNDGVSLAAAETLAAAVADHDADTVSVGVPEELAPGVSDAVAAAVPLALAVTVALADSGGGHTVVSEVGRCEDCEALTREMLYPSVLMKYVCRSTPLINSDVAVALMTKAAVLGVLGAAMTGVSGRLTCVAHACADRRQEGGTRARMATRARARSSAPGALFVHAPRRPTGCLREVGTP
jgi:hypothetical protein